MIVLVTGAGGFLGRQVVAALALKGYGVRTTTRADQVVAAPDLEESNDTFERAVHCNLRTGEGVCAACEGVEAVLHLAIDKSGTEDDMVDFAIVSTTHLLRALRGTNKRLILASSFSVYNWEHVGQVLTEQSPLHSEKTVAALDGYTRAKVAQEHTARLLCHKWKIALTVVRPATIWADASVHLSCIGPEIGPIRFVIGPIRALQLTHVLNCASAFAAVMDDRAAGWTFNVVDGFHENAWRFSQVPITRFRIPIPLTVARACLQVCAAVYRQTGRSRHIPGLLIAARFCARFHLAAADHTQLTRVLGWVPPYPYHACRSGTGVD